MLSRLREPFNGLTHLGGGLAAFFGLIALILVGGHGLTKSISVIVYGLSLIAMFSTSAIYHLARGKSISIQMLRKLDHSAIFLLIAGTYTPFCLIAFTGFWHWGLLTIIWGIAVIGIIVKVFYIKAPRWVNVVIYIIMGWLCILAAPEMALVLPVNSMVWLVTGGIIYTLGAIVYATKAFDFMPGRIGFHGVWHIFVLLGALSHFISVMSLVVSIR
jgi:hemolysin III